MPRPSRRPSVSDSSTSRDSGSRRSRRSSESHTSQSTAPTSLYASPRPSHVKPSSSSKASRAKVQQQPSREDHCGYDLSPGTNCYERSSRETYVSTTLTDAEVELQNGFDGSMDYESQAIPPLPRYRREVVDTHVRPSSPREFAELFPSTNRMSIRHDEFTSDGNMNLRVDTVVPGRRRQSIQLFHLRMYDLAKREFSLRRYGRDSGREVCHSKRRYEEEASPEGRPKIQRSMSNAIRNLSLSGKPTFMRSNTADSKSSKKSSKSSKSSKSAPSYSTYEDGGDYFDSPRGRDADRRGPSPATNTIKLEFSNYARVDLRRRGGKGSKRYEFEWWGHKYIWKRVTEKHLDVVNFHLLRDGKDKPIAHIVPETRSPDQVQADELAGGWIPPCHMWITDKNVVNAMTDVAE